MNAGCPILARFLRKGGIPRKAYPVGFVLNAKDKTGWKSYKNEMGRSKRNGPGYPEPSKNPVVPSTLSISVLMT
ncbi:MAG: hypothetical protein M3O09_01615 [Acidobacteriota bacterium]|nr:hypothetical protein [Acidobacteriota bacterium]